MADNEKAQLSKVNPQMNTLRMTLESAKASMLAVLPKHLTPDRLIKVALVAASKNPELLACSTQSILQCVMLGAELGLEAGGPLGHLYLIPFRDNKRGTMICTPIIGYQGLVELVHRTGRLLSIEAHVVHEHDKYGVKFGRELELWHTPELDEDPGRPKFVYALANLKGGGQQAVVMTVSEIEKIRGRSRAGRSGPWVTDWDEMAKKTALRRLSKLLPKSTELARALEAEDEQAGSEANLGNLQLLPAAEQIEPASPPSKTASVREAVKAANAKVVLKADAVQEETAEPTADGDFTPEEIAAGQESVDQATGEVKEKEGE
jgi:recombination protein RecT